MGDLSGTADQRSPLVLLHGLTFDRSMWHDSLKELASVDPGRRTLLLDLPGHGKSDPAEPYSMEHVAALVYAATEEAGLTSPVMVGHSLGAIVATVYAARYPTSGLVSVDQSLQTQQFSDFLRSISDQLHSPAFPNIWEGFLTTMHIEKLPTPAQDLLKATSNPDQDLVLGYWHDVLNKDPDELNAWILDVLTTLRVARLPFMFIAGEQPGADYRTWLLEQLPQAVIKVLPESGHFPQLAHPKAFADCLAETASWPMRN